MKIIPIIILILFSTAFCFSQSGTPEFDQKSKDRYVVWLIPSAARNIYGIAIGPFGSEAICNRPYTKYSHGLNLQIFGQGFFQPFYRNNLNLDGFNLAANDTSAIRADTLPLRTIHNGLIVSPLGTFTPKVNGLSVSLFMSMGQTVNGISFNLFWNHYKYIHGASVGLVNTAGVVKGVQIGLVNKTAKLRGFQFGLWNKNEKRSLPIINWSFREKKK